MKLLNRLAHQMASRRWQALQRYATEPERVQAEQLRLVTTRLARTQYGTEHGVYGRLGRAMYVSKLPVVGYEEIAPYVERMLRGERHVLTAEATTWFAKSSGTTNAQSKYIPVNNEHLKLCHYKGGMDSILLYLHHHPESQFFSHKAFALAGSYQPATPRSSIRVGDLSAILLMKMPRLGRYLRVPSIDVVLQPEWERKLQLVTAEIARLDVGNISGVPSWMMLVLREVLHYTGASTLKEVWPHLEVFFHGGIAFAPYRSEYQRLLGEGVNYQETYNASEGFFGIQSNPLDSSMLLMLDYGVYYEFIPMEQLGSGNLASATALPLHKVEVGKNYAMLISTTGGLYRYLIGDTIRFTSTAPYKFVITGRTKSFINAFGEELMVHNADSAFHRLEAELGAVMKEYTAGPVFLTSESKGYHHWVVEWKNPPADEQLFARRFDEVLKELNSDYQAKRYKDLSLLPPRISTVPTGTFYQWLKLNQKLGGQNKVPRLSTNNQLVEQLLAVAAELKK